MSGSARTRVLLSAVAFAMVALGGFVYVRGYYRSKIGRLLNVRNLNVQQQFILQYFDSQVWNNTRFLGVRSQQTPTDNWSMQEIIWDTRPDVIVETGTFNGGTSLYYAALLSLIRDDGKVITMDIEPHTEEASSHKLFRDHVEVLTGSSVAPEIVDHIAKEVAGKRVLVTLDSLHTRDHVLKEMELYSRFVPVGGYMVVQDTASNGHPIVTDFGPGPGEAVGEFLKSHPEWVQDREREKFLLTFYPGGYLKRVR